MEFNKKCFKYINSLIAQRRYLLREDKNKKNKLKMVNITEKLSKDLEYDRTNLQFAKYMRNHETEIREVLPGLRAGCHKKFNDELNLLLQQAGVIIESQKIHDEWKH